VVIDLARRLDIHPADLVDGLDLVLANTRVATTSDEVSQPRRDQCAELAGLVGPV
jgi:hypothetical protein